MYKKHYLKRNLRKFRSKNPEIEGNKLMKILLIFSLIFNNFEFN